MMSHEKLDVYQLSIKFVSLTRRIIKRIPRGNTDLADQLKRASRSIPLLIAEGVGKTTPAHQARLLVTHEAKHTNARQIWMCCRWNRSWKQTTTMRVNRCWNEWLQC